ncbi:MAG TPA: S8 family serine peptidase [Verrucomicrobiae bacterium]
MGVTALRAAAPQLNGTGVWVAQPEAGLPFWQVNPSVVSQPQSLFTWISSNGTATAFPNAVGSESGHADQVGGLFYGGGTGVATGVNHVHNYEANFFVNVIISGKTQIVAQVANQSFVYGAQVPTLDSAYDDYAARYGILFLNGAGNGGAVPSPATSYNGIAVAAYGGSSSTGPTTDGRAKPDITAPASLTSFSTPLVAGAAALLLQAALHDDGGSGTAAQATNAILLKGLLLNGAVKPADWIASTTIPLDNRYGAGVLNVMNSWRELRGGRHVFNSASSVLIGSPHLPPATASIIAYRRGWDYNTITSSASQDAIINYFFDLNGVTNHPFTCAATLVWAKHEGAATIANLDLFLYNATNGSLVASSVSVGNNVEHFYATNLPAGRYDLQLVRHGGPGQTAPETYGLVFDFGPPDPPLLVNAFPSGGGFRFRVLGEPNQFIAIQATTDWNAWNSLATNSTGNIGFFDFIDMQAEFSRFNVYRAFQLP